MTTTKNTARTALLAAAGRDITVTDELVGAVAREIGLGVDPDWAARAIVDRERARIRSARRGSGPLTYVDTSPLPVAAIRRSAAEEARLEAMSRREEARAGRILRAAARRGAL